MTTDNMYNVKERNLNVCVKPTNAELTHNGLSCSKYALPKSWELSKVFVPTAATILLHNLKEETTYISSV